MIAERIEKPRKARIGMKLPATMIASVCAAVLLWPATSPAQSSDPSSGGQQSGQSSSSSSKQNPNPDSSSSSSSSSRQKGTDTSATAGSAPPAAADGSDPISRRLNNSAPAQHDVEVGQYYMKKEKYDAAIDRFKDATVLLPDFSLPYKLMGDAYEKKKFLPEAMKAYQKYLTLGISDKEADEVRKHISHLQEEIQDEQKRREAATKP
jgi:tetratricopeptide (TPR) repeat protein